MHSKLLFISFLFLTISSMGQNFFRTYGNTNDEVAQSVVEAKDTSFMVFGTSSSFVDGTSNFYLMNIDSLGNFNWSKTYGGNNIEQGFDICLKPNRNFLLTGYSNSFGNGYDIYTIEVDSVGNEIWSATYGGTDWDFAYSNISFPNGDVLITGNTYSFGNGNSDGYLLMIDDSGDSLWWKNYGTATDNVLRKTILTSSGELVSIGFTVNVNGDKDFYLVKTNITGDTVWTKTYGTPFDDEGFAITEIGNGHYILGGYSEGIGAGAKEAYYFEVDTSGAVMWTQNIGGTQDDCIYDLHWKPNTYRFYSAGYTQSFGNGGNEAQSLKLNVLGGYLSGGNNYGTPNQEVLNRFIFTSHKRVLSVGKTNNPYLNEDVMVIMSDTLLPTQSTMTPFEDVTLISELQLENEVIIYPQPTSGILNLQSEISFQSFEIFDLSGKLVLKESLNSSSINCSSLTDGIYFLQVFTDEHLAYRQKIIITRQ